MSHMFFSLETATVSEKLDRSSFDSLTFKSYRKRPRSLPLERCDLGVFLKKTGAPYRAARVSTSQPMVYLKFGSWNHHSQ